jgi:TonB-dependent SusC/RagA subfamily outer membrane receptor
MLRKKLVTGIVTNPSNFPIPEVNVIVKETKKGVRTDMDGKYSISVPVGQVLVFSYLNYKTREQKISDTSSYNVSLDDGIPTLEELLETIVVGYGTQKKNIVTGAISSVRSEDLEKVANGRIEQALQSRVSGVTIAASSGQPGSVSTVRVRGVTTFEEGGNDPLWVVDGVVVDSGGIGFLNQSDIESIEVLKDAASAAIYGTRAASGVILVTTKKVPFGIQDQEGIVAREISNYNKKNFRLNSTHKISEIFTLGQTLGFLRQKSVGIGNDNSGLGSHYDQEQGHKHS